MTIDLKSILKITFSVLVITFVVGYSLFEFRKIIRGPKIEIFEPQNGASYSENPIKISGVVENVSYLSLNDWQINVNKEGMFEEKILLSPGYNIIKIKATDRFDKEEVSFLELMYNLEK